MPRKTKVRTRPRRRPRRSVRKLQRYATPGKSLGFPKQSVVQLRYASCIELNNTAGIQDLHIFKANSIYDPDETLVGHQPLGRDQWASFYNHYRVLNSKCTVSLVPEAQTAGQSPCISGIYVSDDTTIPAEWESLVESGRGSYILQSQYNTETKPLVASYSQKSFFKHQGKNQSALGAQITADPTEKAYFIIHQQTCNKSDNGNTRAYVVVIDYLVAFSEPKDLEQS